jgi:hypothetical protein
VTEGRCVVVAVERAAGLPVDDGEGVAAEGGVDFGEQPLSAVRNFFAGWLGRLRRFVHAVDSRRTRTKRRGFVPGQPGAAGM